MIILWNFADLLKFSGISGQIISFKNVSGHFFQFSGFSELSRHVRPLQDVSCNACSADIKLCLTEYGDKLVIIITKIAYENKINSQFSLLKLRSKFSLNAFSFQFYIVKGTNAL